MDMHRAVELARARLIYEGLTAGEATGVLLGDWDAADLKAYREDGVMPHDGNGMFVCRCCGMLVTPEAIDTARQDSEGNIYLRLKCQRCYYIWLLCVDSDEVRYVRLDEHLHQRGVR